MIYALRIKGGGGGSCLIFFFLQEKQHAGDWPANLSTVTWGILAGGLSFFSCVMLFLTSLQNNDENGLIMRFTSFSWKSFIFFFLYKRSLVV